MKRLQIMLIAGDPSGDTHAAELVTALREGCAAEVETRAGDPDKNRDTEIDLAPEFFGAGGPRLAAAGVDLFVDLTRESVFGFAEVFRQLNRFRRLFNQLLELASRRQPDLIILVDYAGFNRRFAAAVQARVRSQSGPFRNWAPKIVYFVSPQVWASRPGRARQLARDVDLMLSIFPFEKAWYAARAPQLKVEFVGHPMIDRFSSLKAKRDRAANKVKTEVDRPPLVLLLPGSRRMELQRHLPPILEAAARLRQDQSLRLRMVFPTEDLAQQARTYTGEQAGFECRVGQLAESLAEADLAIASSGTVTLECAYWGVPTVVIYKVSPLTWMIARRIVRVPFAAMPNLLVNERLFPELIQSAVTPENIAREAALLLRDPRDRRALQAKLAELVKTLGRPGAVARAARAILDLLAQPKERPVRGA